MTGRRRWILALAGMLLGPTLSAGTATTLHGKKLRGLPSAKLEDVLARPEAGKEVRLEGTIEKVCQNKGCWLELKQGAKSVHVTFAGYSFFVPKDSAAKPVILEGRVVVKQPSSSDVAHLQGEGAGAAAAATVSIEATGVEIGR
jgi:hypothetical protein